MNAVACTGVARGQVLCRRTTNKSSTAGNPSGRRTRIRPLDMLICVIVPTPAHSGSIYPGWPRPGRLTPWPSDPVTSVRATQPWPVEIGCGIAQRIPVRYTGGGRRRGHGANVRSAGLLTPADPRFRTWI